MSIKLQLTDAKIDVKPADQLNLQYMPVGLAENSPANIDTYFNSYTEEKDGKLTNAFRGYPLDGCQFAVPSHLQGVVFQELNRPLEENVDRTFKVNGIFHDFTYWNYDRDPSENDMWRQALQWADFAKVLHAPITKEQFEGSTKNAEEEVDVKKENDIKMEEN